MMHSSLRHLLLLSCLLLAPLAPAEGAEQAPNSWASTGDLSQVRREHTATLLLDGRVLVVGGSGKDGKRSGIYDTAEFYEPAMGSWSPAGSLGQGQARHYHTATRLLDGRVLVAGGRGSDTTVILSTVELYDPATGTWSPTGSLNQARRDHTATLLPDGRVLVVGGRGAGDTSFNSAELYDPAKGEWSLTAPLPYVCRDHTATLLNDGRVLVAGGRSKDAAFYAYATLYEPVTGQWTPTASLTHGREGHTATLLPGGRILISAGQGVDLAAKDGVAELNTAELYDPGAGTWASTGTVLAQGREGHTATLLRDGRVLISGGTNADTVLASAELYDPATDRWLPAAPLSGARSLHTATLLNDGRVLVAGGDSGSGALGSVELYEAGAPPADAPGDDPPGVPPSSQGSYYSSGCAAAASPQALWPLALLLLALRWRRVRHE